MSERGSSHCLLSLSAGDQAEYQSWAGPAAHERDCTALEPDELAFAALHAQRVMLLGNLASGYVHDLSTLLMTINLISFSLEAKLPADHPARAEIEHLQLATTSAQAMSRQLLAFVRRQPVKLCDVDLRALLERRLPLFARLLSKGISVASDLAPDLWLIRADPVQIEQIVMNMLINARDAMPRGGAVVVSASNSCAAEPEGLPRGEYVCLTFADTGVGMSQATLARMFEPFYTGDPSGDGSGLGLATCHYLARLLGGMIAAESVLGAGTVFRVYLPRSAAAQPAEG